MTALYLIIATFALVAGLIWLARRDAAARALAEREAETNQRMAEHAEAQGNIIAEHRERSDVVKRLRDDAEDF